MQRTRRSVKKSALLNCGYHELMTTEIGTPSPEWKGLRHTTISLRLRMTCQAILMQRLAEMRVVLLSIGLRRSGMFTAMAHTSMVVRMMGSVYL